MKIASWIRSRQVVRLIALAAWSMAAPSAWAQMRAPLPGIPRPASTATTSAIPGMGPLPTNGTISGDYFGRQRTIYGVLDEFEDVDVFADQRKDGATVRSPSAASRSRRQYRPNSLTDGDLAARRRQNEARYLDRLGKINPSRRGETSPRLASTNPGKLPMDRARSGLSSLSSGIPSLDLLNLSARRDAAGVGAAPRSSPKPPRPGSAKPGTGSSLPPSVAPDSFVPLRPGSSAVDLPPALPSRTTSSNRSQLSGASSPRSAAGSNRKISPSELLRRTLEADKAKAESAPARRPAAPRQPATREGGPTRKVYELLDDIE